VLLPWDRERSCEELTADLADAVFGLGARAESAPRPMLGVSITTAESGGVLVLQVGEGSVGAAAGIVEGDVIVDAAGVAVATPADLKEIVGRQAPGTWLPMRVSRGGKSVEIVARFPSGS
jgi:S1-C subfamily serine protease